MARPEDKLRRFFVESLLRGISSEIFLRRLLLRFERRTIVLAADMREHPFLSPAASSLNPAASSLNPAGFELEACSCKLEPCSFKLEPCSFKLEPCWRRA